MVRQGALSEPRLSRGTGPGIWAARCAEQRRGADDQDYRPGFITANRNRACGDAPSIPGKNCDEFPLATTREGLSAGGTRRTFTGCNINAPANSTGPTGASACMITATENDAQGAVIAAFYYDWRVLNNDRYRVGAY